MNYSFQNNAQVDTNQNVFNRIQHAHPTQEILLEVKLKQLHKLAEKMTWMKRFHADYEGGCVDINEKLFGNDVVFYVAQVGDKEVGYIRLNDKTSFFEKYGGVNVWNIADAYVKPAYRHKGVLRQMIQQAVQDLDVKMIHLTVDRYVDNLNYYRTLGFTEFQVSSDGELGWALQTSFFPVVQKRNTAFKQQPAIKPTQQPHVSYH